MALGNISPAHNVVHFNLLLHKKATEVHTIPGLKQNLLSMNRLVAAAGYTAQFEADSISFFDTNSNDQTSLQ